MIKSVYGSTLPLIPSYLDEFMWRERYGLNISEAFDNTLIHIADTISSFPDFYVCMSFICALFLKVSQE